MEAHRADSRAIYELSMEDGREGVLSFADKRKPAYTRRPEEDMPKSVDWDAEPPFDPFL